MVRLERARLGAAQHVEQPASSGGPHAGWPLRRDLALEDLAGGDLLAVEGGVGVRPLDDDGAVDLDAGVEPAGLDVGEDGLERAVAEAAAVRLLVRIGRPEVLVSVVSTGGRRRGLRWATFPFVGLVALLLHGGAKVDHATGTVRSSNHGKVAAQAHARVLECGECLLGVDDADAVVDVNADLEAGAQRVEEDAGRRTPRPVGQARDKDARAAGSGELETGAEGGEYHQTDGLGDDLGRDGYKYAALGLLLGRVDDTARGLGGLGVGRRGKLLGRRICVDAIF